MRAIGHLVPALTLAATLLLCGCGRSPSPAEASQTQDLNDFWTLHQAYSQEKKQPPQRVEDLRPFRRVSPGSILQKVQAGEYVVHWQARGSEVLAWEKDCPDQGGMVLLADGTVKKMSKDEFLAARPKS
jgi:hypothetical protein